MIALNFANGSDGAHCLLLQAADIPVCEAETMKSTPRTPGTFRKHVQIAVAHTASHTDMQAGAAIPGVIPVPQSVCPHGNHYCLACEDCGRLDPRNRD